MDSFRFRSFSRPAGVLFVSALTCLWASAPLASGGYSGGGGFSGSVSRTAPSDPTYDLGKAVYSGRSRSARGLRVCLMEASEDGQAAADETVKLSRRSLKSFKRGSSTELLDQLVDCQDSSSRAAERLNPKEARALVHYLNKRFRLKLDA